jgi:hypothetical protein
MPSATPSLHNLTRRAPRGDEGAGGVFDPIPQALDTLIYAHESGQQEVVRVHVHDWAECHRGFIVSFVGPGDREATDREALDLAAYLLAHFVVRYEFPGMPSHTAVLAMTAANHTGVARLHLREEHADMPALRRHRAGAGWPPWRGPVDGDPTTTASGARLIQDADAHPDRRTVPSRGGTAPQIVLLFPTPSLDREFWSAQSAELYTPARTFAFPHKARQLTRVIEQWVREAYAPRIGHLGAVETTSWSYARNFSTQGDSVAVRLLSDMPVATARARVARAELDRQRAAAAAGGAGGPSGV